MKFYLCQTEDGPQYFHLQAEAKKADPNFQTVEIDLAKAAIMDRLNGLMRQVHSRGTAVSIPAAVLPKPGEVGTFKEGNEPKSDKKWTAQHDDVRAGFRCNVCKSRKEIAAWRASGDMAGEIEELVMRIADTKHLRSIQSLIDEQIAGNKSGHKD